MQTSEVAQVYVHDLLFCELAQIYLLRVLFEESACPQFGDLLADRFHDVSCYERLSFFRNLSILCDSFQLGHNRLACERLLYALNYLLQQVRLQVVLLREGDV